MERIFDVIYFFLSRAYLSTYYLGHIKKPLESQWKNLSKGNTDKIKVLERYLKWLNRGKDQKAGSWRQGKWKEDCYILGDQ